jgi:hypothetical protein
MSAAEAAQEQQLRQRVLRYIAEQTLSMDSVDWSSCQSELDRLRRAARDASDKAGEMESYKSDWESCRRYGNDDCVSKKRNYESEARDFASELDTAMSRYKGAMSSCGR